MGTSAAILCQQCGILPALPGDLFCCDGCRAIFQWMKGGIPVPLDPTEADLHLTKEYGEHVGEEVRFVLSVEPLACEACLQSLAVLEQKFPGLRRVEWNRGASALIFSFAASQARPEFMYQFLQELHLKPVWHKASEPPPEMEAAKQSLLRIGLTAALAGNIMLFAVPIYGGLDGTLRTVFEAIQAVLFAPVMLWSSLPILRTAWVSLRLRQLSVDLPLAIAFLAGSLFSYAALFVGQHDLYFDSLSSFLFLILASRYFLDRSLARHLQSPDLSELFGATFYQVAKGDEMSYRSKSWREIAVGDRVYLKMGQRVPVDGRLVGSSAEFDSAWSTGEATPLLRLQQAPVEAGLLLISKQAVIEVTRKANETMLARLFEQVGKGHEQLRTTPEARIGAVLVLIVFAVSGLLLFRVQDLGGREVFERIFALLIVACPCAVSFAAPLARAKAAHIARRLGFWLKNPQVLESLGRVKKIAFDKTGTLTGGHLTLAPYTPLVDTHWKRIILSLENESRHPIAESLRRSWGPHELLSVSNFAEIPGVGVRGEIDGDAYELRTSALTQDGTLSLELLQNGQRLMRLFMTDEIRPEAQEALERLRGDRDFYIVSGDSEKRVQKFAEMVGIPAGRAFGGLLPQEKQSKLEEIQPDMYVGDGTNDLLALQSAPVSVAVLEAAREAKATANVVMMSHRLSGLLDLFSLADATKRLQKRNFGFALVYNALAGVGAVLGWIDPLTAALLMPISSVILVASTLWGTPTHREFEVKP